ncbi:hypothetical protein Z517_07781 [Fonsecaea pedrosoi CBS 271.37]|uniref:SCP domain-containing protein n=1 Tax=Fonsecaea pedrosoi CBS 271.37 TaxID=1442368 RepID=A0A0D2GBF1_9EURO|nr:uncharacterized protein Z517_07781 [Fonsecaea pedrosoi CBS 271.37]KIW77948.1 hypothetical protein Z517_07781 [Fonsecaea pedrosoi CBS 271.37]
MRCPTVSTPLLFFFFFFFLLVLSSTMSNISTMASPFSGHEHEHEHAMVQGPPLEKRAVPPPPTDATFKNTVLARVNAYRALHSAPAVTWDNALAQAAKTAATRCSPVHTVCFFSISFWVALAVYIQLHAHSLSLSYTPQRWIHTSTYITLPVKDSSLKPLPPSTYPIISHHILLLTSFLPTPTPSGGNREENKPNNPYGENIYSFYLTPPSTVPNFTLWLKKGLDWWYGEVRDYYSWAADHSGQYHFTQLVWKATTKIGCSWSANQCATAHGDYYLVCEFQPKGNIAGQFGGNVLDA